MGSLRAMPAVRRFDLDELATRPGTYFNPETEIVVGSMPPEQRLELAQILLPQVRGLRPRRQIAGADVVVHALPARQ